MQKLFKGQDSPEPDHSTDNHVTPDPVLPDDTLVVEQPKPRTISFDVPGLTHEDIEQIKAVQIQPLTWSRTPIKEVKYNKAIAELMAEDHSFSNWIRTCVMIHSDQNAFETVLTVPDQWSKHVEQITIITAGKSLERNRLLEALQGQFIHVMHGTNKNLND